MPDGTPDRVREDGTEEGEPPGELVLKTSDVLAMLAPVQALQRDTPRPWLTAGGGVRVHAEIGIPVALVWSDRHGCAQRQGHAEAAACLDLRLSWATSCTSGARAERHHVGSIIAPER